ncbi:MAG: M23 family metallopeptidase [Treponema sp.]|nr:M23 family metallopeptidase [Treponema sp.]
MNKKEFHDTMLASKKALITFYNMIFNTKIKKVVNLAVVGFVSGIAVTTIVISTINSRFSEKNAMGGFESPSNPDFSKSEDSNTLVPELALENNQANSLITADSSLPPLTYKTYRVKQGDMIGIIAEENDVSQDTLITVNHITATRSLQIGTYLKIPSIPGILYTVRQDGETFDSIAKAYDISAEKCAVVNNMAQDVSLKAGSTLFLPDALMDDLTRKEINGDLFHKPLKSRYYLTSNYGWRTSPFNPGKRSFHGGTDMATSAGTSIYAALDGRVSFTGYNETYGNYVIITHHSGYKTLYAHMSSISCKKGQYVYTNTIIGKVGSTGMSTGPHLHFAVYKNGKGMNPMSLIN